MRLSTKPDASFFKKIAIGAMGTRAICDDLSALGHQFVELERGSTDTKLWKDVKRKRVRIPDLVCLKCGKRVESRAKTDSVLAMSHSTDAERAWDFGMIDDDIIGFPVCHAAQDDQWSAGHLDQDSSYWRERNRIQWQIEPWINYFPVSAFRATAHSKSATKGATEGSETSIEWAAAFSSRNGKVSKVIDTEEHIGISIALMRDGIAYSPYTWRVKKDLGVYVASGDEVKKNQIIGGSVKPLSRGDLVCLNDLDSSRIAAMLQSRERTVRFTGVKLARLIKDFTHATTISQLECDPVEDIYIRLEAASYLTAAKYSDALSLFGTYLKSIDDQVRLETVIAAAETGTEDAVLLLISVIDDNELPLFLRSAAAWGLGLNPSPLSTSRLIKAFGDISDRIRQDALDSVTAMGAFAVDPLFSSLSSTPDIAAGSAEALRRCGLPPHIVESLVEKIGADPTIWEVWLAGQWPRSELAEKISELQSAKPEVHYALNVLYAFVNSWISDTWEKRA